MQSRERTDLLQCFTSPNCTWLGSLAREPPVGNRGLGEPPYTICSCGIYCYARMLYEYNYTHWMQVHVINARKLADQPYPQKINDASLFLITCTIIDDV